MNFLVVDDESIIRKNFIKRIQALSLGHSMILEAKNGYDALEIMQEETIHIALIDINMPFFDGLSLISKIREINTEVKIIIISGYENFDYAKRAIEYGVTAYLLKPIDREEFNEVMTKTYQEVDLKEVDSTFKGTVVATLRKNVENPDFNLSVLSKELNLSPNYLSKRVKETFNQSFVDLLRELRIDKAKKLLEQMADGKKIYEVAQQTGFKNQYYFSQVFKQEVGLSPKQYYLKVHFTK
ncbi:hypothetical protein IGI37_003761 [Enterococcus sp. AZ194]|uniref:response regulator transcription factor n=1 Tax=Enterococcus sp. AZ194 TaxID=2774629 RepID=UPI003F21B6C6